MERTLLDLCVERAAAKGYECVLVWRLFGVPDRVLAAVMRLDRRVPEMVSWNPFADTNSALADLANRLVNA